MSKVYFALSTEDKKLLRIGCTDLVENYGIDYLMRYLRNKYEMELILIIDTKGRAGLENNLKEQFDEYRIEGKGMFGTHKGNTFRYEGKLKKFIEDVILENEKIELNKVNESINTMNKDIDIINQKINKTSENKTSKASKIPRLHKRRKTIYILMENLHISYEEAVRMYYNSLGNNSNYNQ